MKKKTILSLLLLSLSLSIFPAQSYAADSNEPPAAEEKKEEIAMVQSFRYRIYDSYTKKVGNVKLPIEQYTNDQSYNLGKTVLSAYVDTKVYKSHDEYISGAAPIESKREYISLDEVPVYKKVSGQAKTEATSSDITFTKTDAYNAVDPGEKIYEINATTEAKYFINPDQYDDNVSFLIRSKKMLGYIPASKGATAVEKYRVSVKKNKTVQWYLHYTEGLTERNLSFKKDKKSIKVYKMSKDKGGNHFISGKAKPLGSKVVTIKKGKDDALFNVTFKKKGNYAILNNGNFSEWLEVKVK